MRLPAALLVCLCLAAEPALSADSALPADPAPATTLPADRALRLQPGEDIRPGHAAWPLGERLEHGWRVTVSSADDPAHPAASGFRIEIVPRHGPQGAAPSKGAAPAQSAADPRACIGLASAGRLDLYLTRAAEFRIKASTPVAGMLMVTSANTQDSAARDRFFGSFGIGAQWKTLRLSYGALAPLPGWEALAARQGLRPGDGVLRPDSVEALCLGVEAGRLPPGQPVTLWIDSLRFAR